MELTGVSGSSSYDQLQQLQLLKEKDKKAAEQAATESAQITAAGTATDKTSEAAVQSTFQNIDTLEISPEGRAYQQNMQTPPAPVDSTASETLIYKQHKDYHGFNQSHRRRNQYAC